MGSRSHTTGQGFQPSLIGRRTLRAVLASESQAGADNRFATYVSPAGNGEHWVRNPCNETPYKVGSALGSMSFKPGTQVLLGSNAGTQGEVIIGLPPAGRAGGSQFAIAGTVRRGRFNVSGPPTGPTCPTCLLGRSYLAVRDGATLDFGAGPEVLYAWRYVDGEYQETLAEFDYSALGLSLGSDPSMQRVHTVGDHVVFTASHSGWDRAVCTWNVAANTLAVLNCTHPSFVADGSHAIWNGAGDLYFFLGYGSFFPTGTRHLQMYKVSVGAAGSWNEVAARVGAPHAYVAATGFAPGPQLLHSGGNTFQVPSRWYGAPGTNETIAYFAGSWDEGMGRQTLANDGSMGNGWDGYVVSGNRSIRITFGPLFEPPATIGLIPQGPGSPEVSLLPAELTGETLAALYHLQVSPSRGEFAVFVDPDGNTGNRLLRWGVDQAFTPGCPLPYFEVEPAPGDIMPGVMFPQDH